MAFQQENFGVIGQNGQNSLFMYTTEDADTVVQADDYFLSAYKGLRVGDFILCNMSTGGTRETKILYVSVVDSANVNTGFPTIA